MTSASSTSTSTSPPLSPAYTTPTHLIPTFIACLILPIIFVSLRFLGRRVERVSWWWDDWTALLSLLLFIAGFWADLDILRYTSPTSTSTSAFPRQDPDLSPFLIRIYILTILHPLISGLSKASGLLLYDIHFGLSPSFRRPIPILIALVSAWSISVFLATIFQCRPISGAWDPTGKNNSASCISRPALLQASAAIEVALNILILAATLPGSCSIDWIFGRGTLITLSYLLGLFVTVASVLAAYYAGFYTPTPSSTLNVAQGFIPLFLWMKLNEAFSIVVVSLWPSVFGILAIVTCNYSEPKGRIFAFFRKKTRERISGEGLGQLLGDSEERRRAEMRETQCGMGMGIGGAMGGGVGIGRRGTLTETETVGIMGRRGSLAVSVKGKGLGKGKDKGKDKREGKEMEKQEKEESGDGRNKVGIWERRGEEDMERAWRERVEELRGEIESEAKRRGREGGMPIVGVSEV